MDDGSLALRSGSVLTAHDIQEILQINAILRTAGSSLCRNEVFDRNEGNRPAIKMPDDTARPRVGEGQATRHRSDEVNAKFHPNLKESVRVGKILGRIT